MALRAFNGFVSLQEELEAQTYNEVHNGFLNHSPSFQCILETSQADPVTRLQSSMTLYFLTLCRKEFLRDATL
uniref:Uncharacterized protein n=1 Tax=Physcomitrium patens TaxID=3218 RepID=A0A2K1IG72_PHYPA|nr:hypothetical protein PHYPA_028868 [Physcomitrium patens]